MIKKYGIPIIFTLILFFSCANEKPDIAFVNINIVPMNTEIILEHQTVIIRDGKFLHIGPAEEIQLSNDCIIIDGKEKYLMPGLADMHAHTWYESELILFLVNGVTTIRNMGGTPKHLDWKKKIQNGELLSPEIYTAGPVLDGYPPLWPGSVEIEGPNQAEKTISKQKEDGYDFLKIYNNLSKSAFEAIMSASKKYKMPVAGHVPFDVPLTKALEAGITSIEHFEGYGIALQSDDSPFKDNQSSMTRIWDNLDETKTGDIVKKTKESGVWNCPTMVVFQNLFIYPERVEIELNQKMMQYVAPGVIDGWLKRNYNSEIASISQNIYEARKKLLKALHDADTNILLGTDCGSPFTVQGFSIHEELLYFIDAGFSPYEAIKAGTADAAKFLNASNQFGTIETGKQADLICVEANPLEDIKNVSKILGVMVRGKWLPKEKLNKMLDDIAIKHLTE